MIRSSIFEAASTAEFRAAAFADYLEDVNAEYSKLMSFVLDATANNEYDPDDYEQFSDYTDLVISEALTNIGYSNDVLSKYVTLNQGYAQLGELLYHVIQESCIAVDTDDPAHDTAMYRPIIPLYYPDTANSMHLSDVLISATEALGEMKNNFHASIVLMAAVRAAGYEDVATRLASYSSTIKQYFKDEYDDLSATASYYRALLSDAKQKASDVCSNIYDSLSLVERLSLSTPTFAGDSIVARYTGATPVPTLDWKKVLYASVLPVYTAIVAVENVVKLGLKYGKKLFKWAKKTVGEKFDPYDLTVIDKTATTPSVDGFVIQDVWEDVIIGRISAAQYGWIEAKLGNWLKYEFLCGEVLCRADALSKDEETGIAKASLTLQIKPYPVKPDAVYQACVAAGFTPALSYSWTNNSETVQCSFYQPAYDPNTHVQMTFEEIASILTNLQQLDFIGDPDVQSEVEMHQAFLMGANLCGFILCSGLLQMEANDITAAISPVQYAQYAPVLTLYAPDIAYQGDQGHPTNKDFLTVASGWNGNTATPAFSWWFARCVPHSWLIATKAGTMTLLMLSIPLSLAIQGADRAENPLNYIFLPYRNNAANFHPGKFGIRTDAENQRALDFFITTVVVVALAIYVSVVATISLKKIAKYREINRTAFMGRCDNKMWNSQPLTNKEIRKYLRYKSKMTLADAVASGVQATDLLSNVRALASTGITSDTMVAPQVSMDEFRMIKRIITGE